MVGKINNTWIFDDCTVYEIDDEQYTTIEDGWSDGFGNAVCLENMEE